MYIKDIRIFCLKCQFYLIYTNYSENGIDKAPETIPRLVWTVSLVMSTVNIEGEVVGRMLHICYLW